MEPAATSLFFFRMFMSSMRTDTSIKLRIVFVEFIRGYPQVGQGWIFDGVAFGVPNDSDPSAVPLHQFHYDQSGTYGGWRFNYNTTMKPASQGWTYDHVLCKVYKNQQFNTIPVYQYHAVQSDGSRFHFSYSNKPANQGWTKDGIAFYAYAVPGQVE